MVPVSPTGESRCGRGPGRRDRRAPAAWLDERDPLIRPWVAPALHAYLDAFPAPRDDGRPWVVGRHGLEMVAGCLGSPGRWSGSHGGRWSHIAIVYVLRDPLAAALHALHRCAATVLVLDVTAEGARLWPATPSPALAGAGLSVREIDVLALVLARRTNAEIAAALGVAPTTVRSHCRALLRKLGAGDRRELWRLAADFASQPPGGPSTSPGYLSVPSAAPSAPLA